MTWRAGESFVVHIRCDDCRVPLREHHEREEGVCDYCAGLRRVAQAMDNDRENQTRNL